MAAAVVIALACSATVARAQERTTTTETAPEAYTPRWGLVVVGGGVFALFWGVGIAMAAADAENGVLAVPLVGPWIALAENERDDDLLDFSFAMIGVFEAIGLLTVVLGLVSPLVSRSAGHRAADVRVVARGTGIDLVATW